MGLTPGLGIENMAKDNLVRLGWVRLCLLMTPSRAEKPCRIRNAHRPRNFETSCPNLEIGLRVK